MTYNTNDIAKYIVVIANEHGDAITPLKLQKILYYVQGAYLSLRGYPVFDEDILAWKHGPVVYSVYRANKKYGSGPIPPDIPDVPILDFDKKFIEAVYLKYKDYTAEDLVEKTHNEAPYRDTDRDDVISEDSIKKFFSTEVFTHDNLLSDRPIVDALPKDDYDPSEDDLWQAHL